MPPESLGDIADIAGTETQSHCHSHVPSSSCPAAAGAVVRGGDAVSSVSLDAGDAVEAVAAGFGATAVGAVDATTATFVCVTGPLSPALPIRTLTLRFVGAVWTAQVRGTSPLDPRVQAMSLQDPKILVALLSWAIYSFEAFLARRIGWGGRRTAYLSALGFAIVLLNLVPISYFLTRSHDF